MISLKRILVATDFSDPSTNALMYARAFAERFRAALELLHVLEDPLIFAQTAEGFAMPPGFFEDLEREARDKLDSLLTDQDRQSLGATTVIKRGSPFVEIIRYAKENNTDLIILGTHGRGPIAHMLMGSVAERVVRKAPCPVLTVRHPEHEFVMP